MDLDPQGSRLPVKIDSTTSRLQLRRCNDVEKR